jgi:hypothetical protein
MTRKIARQSEVTPLNTIDEYLWNERLGVTQLPPTDVSQQGQSPISSLPPQSSQAPTIDYDSSSGESDMNGSGVSGQGQLIAPKVPQQERSSTPAVSKAASTDSPFKLADHLMTEHAMDNDLIRDHEENVKLHNQEHSNFPTSLGHKHSYKTAVSTLYGDVDPTPTTGESNNGSQSNRNNSPDEEPGGPGPSPSKAPAAAGELEGGAGLASDLGEAASLAVLANKYHIGSALDPKAAKFKYIRHNSKTGKWEIFSKHTGKTLSTHDSEKQAEKAFSAMEANMHG